MDWQAIVLTLQLAAVVCGVLMVVALPLAYWLTFSRWRWKFLVESVVALPLVLPPTVLGFYLLVALGTRSPVGRAWEGLFGQQLVFTFEGLVLASVIFNVPFAVQPIQRAFEAIPLEIRQAGACCGMAPSAVFPAGLTHEVSLDQPGHVGVVPGGLLALPSEAGAPGTIGPGQVQRDPAQERQVPGRVPLAHPARVLAEGDSSTQWSPFSIRQWFRMAAASASGRSLALER